MTEPLQKPKLPHMSIWHYMAFVPELHFGMSEDEFVRYSSSYEPRSLLLAKLRDDMGWRVAIHMLSSKGSRRRSTEPLNIPIHFHELTGRFLIHFFSKFGFARRRLLRVMASARFRAELSKEPPAIFVFRGNMFSIFSHGLARDLTRRKIPYIYENHGLGTVIDPKLRTFVEGAKRIFVLSQEAADEVVEGYGISAQKVVVITNGVATGQFKPAENRDQKGFPRMAYVGRLSREKGFDLAVEALRQTRKQWPEATLEVAGKTIPETQSFCEEILRALDTDERAAIRLRGWLDSTELVNLYSSADVLLFPSRIAKEGHGEGEPRSVLEGMSCGLPVLAIDGSGAHCNIIVRSGTGALSPDAASYTDVAMRYLEDTSKLLEDRIEARKYILENHSIEAAYEIYKRCCLEALEKNCR